MPAATKAVLTLGLPPVQLSHEKLQSVQEHWLFVKDSLSNSVCAEAESAE